MNKELAKFVRESVGFLHLVSSMKKATGIHLYMFRCKHTIVPGPRPKIGPSQHIEGNLLSKIPNESSGPEDFRSASNFFGSRVENGLKGAYCSKPPATCKRLPSALQAHSTLSGYDSGLVCWNYFKKTIGI